MKKVILLIFSVVLLSFQTNQEKKIKFEFTVQEVQLIFDALGELPAKQVEQLRAKIVAEVKKQLTDSTQNK